MKVKIGSLEIEVDTMDELDELVKRYGNTPATSAASAELPAAPKHRESSDARQQTGAADTVLLKKLSDAGDAGMTTDDIGTILGRRGKAARRALDEWATRIGLTSGDNMDAFEFARVGTRRGWRIKSSLLDVARHLLNQK